MMILGSLLEPSIPCTDKPLVGTSSTHTLQAAHTHKNPLLRWKEQGAAVAMALFNGNNTGASMLFFPRPWTGFL